MPNPVSVSRADLRHSEEGSRSKRDEVGRIYNLRGSNARYSYGAVPETGCLSQFRGEWFRNQLSMLEWSQCLRKSGGRSEVWSSLLQLFAFANVVLRQGLDAQFSAAVSVLSPDI